MIADAEQYTAEAVAAGIAKPSRDERARVRYLVLSSLGALLLSVTFDDAGGPRGRFDGGPAFPAVLTCRCLSCSPKVSLTRRMLDDYLVYVGDPPGTGPRVTASPPDPAGVFPFTPC